MSLHFNAAPHTFSKADIIMQDMRFPQHSFRGLKSSWIWCLIVGSLVP